MERFIRRVTLSSGTLSFPFKTVSWIRGKLGDLKGGKKKGFNEWTRNVLAHFILMKMMIHSTHLDHCCTTYSQCACVCETKAFQCQCMELVRCEERAAGTYLGMGEKMLSPARNFLMVPPALNQLCLFSCCALRNSLLRCFHCCEVNVLRILPRCGQEESQATDEATQQDAIKCLCSVHLSVWRGNNDLWVAFFLFSEEKKKRLICSITSTL